MTTTAGKWEQTDGITWLYSRNGEYCARVWRLNGGGYGWMAADQSGHQASFAEAQAAARKALRAHEPISIDQITSELDAITRSLADVPGRMPGDKDTAHALLALTMAMNDKTPSIEYIKAIVLHGTPADDVIAIARSLSALALRLGAWLGRNAE